MTTQTLGRLIVATVAVALLGLLLFSERITPAAKADKRAKADTIGTDDANRPRRDRNHGKHSFTEVECVHR